MVGGLYYKRGTCAVEHLLIGSTMMHSCSTASGELRVGQDGAAIAETLKSIIGGTGFTGTAPGGKSR